MIALYASEPFDRSPGSIRGPCRCVLQDARTLLLAEFGNDGARLVDLSSGSTLSEWKVAEVVGGGAFAVAKNERFVVIGTRVPGGALDDDLSPASIAAGGALDDDLSLASIAAGGAAESPPLPMLPASPPRPAFSPVLCDDADADVTKRPMSILPGRIADAAMDDGEDTELACLSAPRAATAAATAAVVTHSYAHMHIFDATAPSGSGPLCVLPVLHACAVMDLMFACNGSKLLMLPLGTGTLDVFEINADIRDTAHIITSSRTLNLHGSTPHLTAICMLDAFPSAVFVADQAANCVRAYALHDGEILFQLHVPQPVSLTVEQPDTLIVLCANKKQSLISTFKISPDMP